MIDSLTIFTKSGVILYHHNLQAVADDNDDTTPGCPTPPTIDLINEFVSTTLLDHVNLDRAKRSMRTMLGGAGGGGCTVAEWEDGKAVSPDRSDWMAVAFYPEVVLKHGSGTKLAWVRHLLRSVLREYGLFYDSVVSSSKSSSADELLLPPDGTVFNATFRALLRRSEGMGRRQQQQANAGVSESFNDAGEVVDGGDLSEEEDDDDEATNDGGEGKDTGDNNDDDGPVDTQAGIARLKARSLNKKSRGGGGSRSDLRGATDAAKKGKENRVWHDGTGKVTKSALKSLDKSKDKNSAGGLDSIDAAVADNSRALAEARAAYLPASDEVPSWEEEDVLLDYADDGGDGEAEDGGGSAGGWGSSLKGLFEQMSGNKVLTKDDLEVPLTDMHRMLTSKNVANEVATEICDGVRDKLVGKRLQSFGRVKTAVRHALESAIEKVLKPAHGRDVDVLRSVVTKRERSSGGGFFGGGSKKPAEPYTIVMVGINGVGKSTSLAKIAYYLKSNGCSPLIAACDTFRSGAVEQLNVHAKCLDVPLYHRGYAKDPSAVATAAVAHATQEGNDVVLVDTAGRMQNNVPLMKALSKLVVENKPDLVLFVCEALVGNDGMDQLHMFNGALRSGGHSRQIDGVVLTKFDTVSDKVGAALTMTHITGSPVVFVGTGQKYNHLKKLSVQSVIKSLFA